MDRLPQKLPFSSRTLPKTVILSYVLDYAIIVLLGAVYAAISLINPYHQHFSLRNYTLQYPYAVHERVPLPLLYATAIAAPAAIIAFYTLVIDGLFSHSAFKRRKYKLKDRLWELNCGLLGLFLSILLSYVITGTLKNAIGKPRPDLVSRCIPKEGSGDPLPFGLSNSTICTQKDMSILNDGFRSFPSGHSSTSFAGLYFLSLYLAGKLHVLDSRGEVWRSLVVLIPSLGAALIAGSRIMDARHHPFDVISGSLLGILSAWISYRQYFPPLSEFRAKGRAYPIRSWGKSLSDDPAPQHTQYVRTAMDEEGAQPKFVSGRVTPPENLNQEGTGNVFRDEIHASQRQRRQASQPTRGGPSSQYSTDPTMRVESPPPPVPSHQVPASEYQPAGNPFARTVSQRGRRDNIWDSSDDEDELEGYELEPSYTLSNPNQYETPGYERFRTQDTSYHSRGESTTGLVQAAVGTGEEGQGAGAQRREAAR